MGCRSLGCNSFAACSRSTASTLPPHTSKSHLHARTWDAHMMGTLGRYWSYINSPILPSCSWRARSMSHLEYCSL